MQHSSLLSVQNVQTVVAAFAGWFIVEQMTAAPLVLFLPQLPHVKSDEQVSPYMLDPG